jgi:membrane protein implicated in regulation of membrane protease activity
VILKYLLRTTKQKVDPSKNSKKLVDALGIGIVDRAFHPVLGGRVRFQGTTWPAFTEQEGESFSEEDIVRVLKRVGISLKVEKYS